MAREKGPTVRRLATLFALLALAGLLVGLPPMGYGPPPPPPPPVAPHADSLAVLGKPPAAAVRPGVTGSFDWDPMQFVGPAGVPSFLPGGIGSKMVTDDNRTTVLYFGGISPVGLLNLTLTANETTGLWSNISASPAPSARANFSFAADPALGLAILFGGLTNLSSHHVTNDTWVYYFANETWVNVTHGKSPPRRESAAFAIDPTDGVGLLQGGWNPFVLVGGSPGSVIWNDTWTFNLTTFRWSEVKTAVGPPPLEGSGLAYSPESGLFLLFGGCGTFCSSRLWSFAPGAVTWHPMSVSGDPAPPPREGAVVVWEDQAQSVLVEGGDAPTSGGLIVFNDTYLLTPETASLAVNNLVVSPDVPSPRYGAPGTYLGANGCPGVFMMGGDVALDNPPTDAWFLDANPDLGEGCNVWGGDSIDTGNNSGGGGPCGPAANLTVLVEDRFNATPLANASVTVSSGKCGAVTRATDALGVVTFTNLSARVYSLLAGRVDYHPNNTLVNLSAGGSQFLEVLLAPLPRLIVRTFGDTLLGNHSVLPGASVYLDGELQAVGVTDVGGWFNLTGVDRGGTVLSVEAQEVDFSNATVSLDLPYSGTMWANLTLYAYGQLEVFVRSATTGAPITNASGTVTAVDVGPPVPYEFTVDPLGDFTATLPQGNYTVSAHAVGFVANATPGPVFHPWVNRTYVWVNLTPYYGSNLSVELVDQATGLGIPGGLASLGHLYNQTTNSAGWAFFVDVLPPGEYAVLGTAPGYIGNSSFVNLPLLGHPGPVLLNLTPIPGCPPTAQCIGGPVHGTTGGFTLLPSGGATLGILIALPLVLLLAVAVFAWNNRRRSAPPPRPSQSGGR